MNPAPTSPDTAWRRIASRHARTVTFIGDDTDVLTHHALIAQAAAHIPTLRAAGIDRGEPVLVTAHTSMEFLSCFLGLMLHGAVPVPLPPQHALKAPGQFLTRLGPLLEQHRRIICTTAEKDEVQSAAPVDCRITTLTALAQARDDEFGHAAAARLARGSADWPLPAPTDDAYVQYTSGSTAAPRGVVVTYHNLLANMDATGRGLGFRPDDVMTSWLPLHHDMGLVSSLAAALFNGIATVFTTPQQFLYDPLGFLRLLTRTGATHTLMPNFALEWLINARNRPSADIGGIDLQAMRCLMIASEPVNAASMRRFVEVFTGLGLGPTALCSGYGLAESTCAVALSAPDTGFRTEMHHGTEVVTGGRVLDGYEVRIDAPPGERAGTIKLRGPSVSTTAYIDGKKAGVLDGEGFCDTHDLGYLVDDELVILGRQDEVFIVRGENRFPYDIEFAVRTASGQERIKVASFGLQNRIVVVLENRTDTPTDLAQAERLRQQVLISTGLAVDELLTVRRGTIPVTTSGKIKRTAVAEAYRSDTLPRLTTHTWAPDPPSNHQPGRPSNTP
ncbi:AMP-binding protein [Streptomyces noboritoensis]|uniref:AMP-binding protein n=1 Tax=Streptomyces noboritoensis TaxID=67337 RepID=A0ABV6T9M9_9ACTN